MSKDAEQDRYVAKAHEEVATRNARTAVTMATELKVTIEDRMHTLEALVGTLQFEITHLHQKYNLMLTKNFNGGSTVDLDGDNS